MTKNSNESNSPKIALYTGHGGTRGTILNFRKAKIGGARAAGSLGGIYDFEEETSSAETNSHNLQLNSEIAAGVGASKATIHIDNTAVRQEEPIAQAATNNTIPKRVLLVKQDNPQNDMAEYLTGRIFQETAPGFAAKIDIVRPAVSSGPDDTGKDVYIGSHFLEGYQDLFKVVNQNWVLHKDGRVFAAGTINKLTNFLRKGLLKSDNTPRYEGFPQAMVTSLLVGDFDVHTGNVGLIPTATEGKEGRLIRIDYGCAFAKLESEINPHSWLRHPPGAGPTNHFREFPREMRISQELADHALIVADKDLTSAVTNGISELKEHYGTTAFLAFAKKTMDSSSAQSLSKSFATNEYKQLDEIGKRDVIADKVQSFLTSRIKERQKSLRQFALEINIGLCFDEKGNFITNIGDETGQSRLKRLMQAPQNKEYFTQIIRGEKAINLRSKSHKSQKLLDWICWKETRLKASIKKHICQLNVELLHTQTLANNNKNILQGNVKEQAKKVSANLTPYVTVPVAEQKTKLRLSDIDQTPKPSFPPRRIRSPEGKNAR